MSDAAQSSARSKPDAVNETVTIIDNTSGSKADFPLLSGTIGPKVIDVRKLYDKLGHFTFDPGYMATGSTESAITYIDGDEGVLLHRGYPIEQLAEGSTFLEVAHLLLNGELPNPAQKKDFETGVLRHTMLHEQLRRFYDGF